MINNTLDRVEDIENPNQETSDSIEIKRIIAHNLNLENFSDGPIIAKFCLELTDQGILDFFKTHLQKSRESSYTKRCAFMPREINKVRDSITELSKIDSNTGDFNNIFINTSVELVNHLQYCMQGKSTSDGSFIFIEYIEDGETYIAILKMDANKNIRVSITDEGVPKVEFFENALPSLNEKLHKATFIKLLNFNETEESIHLFVLDRQRAGYETSAFFLTQFLAAKSEATPQNMTSAVHLAIKQVAKKIIKDPKDIMHFHNNLKNELSTSGTFNLDEDFPKLIRSYVTDDLDITPQISSIKQIVSQKVVDPVYSFEKCPEVIPPIIYKDDFGSVNIRIDSSLSKGSDYTITNNADKTIFTFDGTVSFSNID